MSKRVNAEKIILGIDPGTNVMGYGVIRVNGNKAGLIAMGVIDMRKMTDPYLKLGRIFDRVTGVIEEYLPDEMAIEAPFFGKNVQSMLKLGRAQGVAIACATEDKDGNHRTGGRLEGAGSGHVAAVAKDRAKRHAKVLGCHRCARCSLLSFPPEFHTAVAGPALWQLEGLRQQEPREGQWIIDDNIK